jgi:hypothetical protein
MQWRVPLFAINGTVIATISEVLPMTPILRLICR